MRFKSKDLSVRVLGTDRKLRMILLADDCGDELTLDTGCDTQCTATENCGDCTCETQCDPTTEGVTQTGGGGGGGAVCMTRCETLTEIMGFHLKMIGELIGVAGEETLIEADVNTQINELEAIIEGLRSEKGRLEIPKDED